MPIKRFLIIAILLVASTSWAIDDCGDADATTWCIETTDSTADGDTMCDGGVCDKTDVIIIDGPARGDLLLENFDGVDDYIVIKNNDSLSQVVLTEDGQHYGILRIEDSGYIDIQGSGYASHDWTEGCTTSTGVCYGIQLTDDAGDADPGITMGGNCDNVKIGYIEINLENDTSGGEIGIQIQDSTLTSSTVFSNWEIHHNYIHDVPYSGMYLGHNGEATSCEGSHDCPEIADFNVHHNLLEDMGAYGITMKGYDSSNTLSELHHNIIRGSNRASGDSTGLLFKDNSGTAQAGAADEITLAAGASASNNAYNEGRIYLTGGTGSGQDRRITDYTGATKVADITPSWGTNPSSDTTYEIKGAGTAHGIAVHYADSEPVDVYSNWIEKTYGPCITLTRSGMDNVEIFNNILLECGAVNTPGYGHGIGLACSASDPVLYNNTIVEPVYYGIAIYANCGAEAGTHKDNLIVEPALGTSYYHSSGLTNVGGDYENSEIATVAGVGFVSADGDSDFSDDDFDLAVGHSAGPTGAAGFPTLDYDGLTRDSPSVDGAYELGFDITDSDCADGDATTWCIRTSDTSFDGDTDCGGACSGGDTLYLEGGARGSLLFRDLDGSGSYITIINEDTDRVILTHDQSWAYVLGLYNCQYVDLRGDNNESFTYGIKTNADDAPSPTPAGNVKVWGESDNIKISYIEITQDNTDNSNGIQVQDAALSDSHTFDTFEIHHNYIHDIGYAGMYLGHNSPRDSDGDDNPYTDNFLIHDNLIEDSGYYAMTLKGSPDGSDGSAIYNNTIKRTGIIYSGSDHYITLGIGLAYFYDTAYAKVYNNWVEETKGPGLYIREANHLIYNNVIVGCGTSDHATWGHGIVATEVDYMDNRDDNTIVVYNNTIVEPTGYGIYSNDANAKVSHKDNIIVHWGDGEASGDGFTEGSSDYANTAESDAADIGFITWSDDSDYSNDNFDLAAGHSVGQTGAAGFPTLDYDGVTRNSPSVDGAYGFDFDGASQIQSTNLQGISFAP